MATTTDTTTRVIEIRTNYADAIKGISEYMKKLEETREAEAELRKAIADTGEATDADREQLAALKQAQTEYKKGIQQLSKEIQNNIIVENQNNDSLAALRAELSNATREYDTMSAAERNGAKGKELQQHINDITNELKSAEEGTQRFYRNVGNYKNSIMDAISAGNPFIKQIMQMTAGAKTGTEAFGNITTAAKGFGKQLLALLANPIVAILAAIAAAIMAVSKAIKSSEELTNRWNAAMAPLQRALQAAMKVLQDFAGVIISAIEGAEKLVGKLADWAERLPGVGKRIKEINDANRDAIALAKEKADIEKQGRDDEVQNAEDAARVAQLRSEAQKKDKYTAEERLAMLTEANDLEAAQMERNKELAERRLAVLEEEATWNQNSKELNEQIAQAKIDVANAEAEYYNGTRRLQKQMQTAQKEIDDEEKAASAERIRRIEEERAAREKQMQEEIADMRKLTDLRIAAIKDRYERETAQENESFAREIAEIQNRLDTEATLTEAQRAALNEQIELLTAAHEQRLTDIAVDQAQQRQQEMQEQYTRTLQLRLAVVQQGSAEELEIRKELLTAQMEQELASEQYTDEQRALIRESFQMQIDALEAAWNQKQIDDARKTAEEIKRIEQQKYNAVKSVYANMTSLVEAFGEDNEAAAKAAKIMALGQIAVETGKAIAEGVTQAIAAGPFPANLAAIASTIAVVLANMATAVSTVKSAGFSTGGVVRGAGSGTSDSIPARLSDGESVNTALATSMFAPLYSVLNQLGGGVAYTGGGGNEEMGEAVLTRAFAKGAALIRPIVSVAEINQANARVSVLESLGRV